MASVPLILGALSLALPQGALASPAPLHARQEHSANHIIFPEDNESLWRSITVTTFLVGSSVLAYCIASTHPTLSLDGFRNTTFARWILFLIFLDTWAFLYIAGLATFGIGLSSGSMCNGAIFLCIVLYASSKVLIYIFLVERVYVVHARYGDSRLRSPAYRLCMAFIVGYFVIIGLMVWGRIAFVRDGSHYEIRHTTVVMNGDDGACVIGLGKPSSLSLLIYDLILNVFFTCMFLYPVFRSTDTITPRLKRLAKRTLCAAAVALLTSAINMAVLTFLHGQELGWVCLASCGADATINAFAIFFVTRSVDDHEDDVNDTIALPKLHPQNPKSGTSAKGILAPPTVDFARPQQQSVHFDPLNDDRSPTPGKQFLFPPTGSFISVRSTRSKDEDKKPSGKRAKAAQRPSMTTSVGRIPLHDKYAENHLASTQSIATTMPHLMFDNNPKAHNPEETELEVRTEGPHPRSRSHRASTLSLQTDPTGLQALDIERQLDTPSSSKPQRRLLGHISTMLGTREETQPAQRQSPVVVSITTTEKVVHALRPAGSPFEFEGPRWRDERFATVSVGHVDLGL